MQTPENTEQSIIFLFILLSIGMAFDMWTVNCICIYKIKSIYCCCLLLRSRVFCCQANRSLEFSKVIKVNWRCTVTYMQCELFIHILHFRRCCDVLVFCINKLFDATYIHSRTGECSNTRLRPKSMIPYYGGRHEPYHRFSLCCDFKLARNLIFIWNGFLLPFLSRCHLDYYSLFIVHRQMQLQGTQDTGIICVHFTTDALQFLIFRNRMDFHCMSSFFLKTSHLSNIVWFLDVRKLFAYKFHRLIKAPWNQLNRLNSMQLLQWNETKTNQPFHRWLWIFLVKTSDRHHYFNLSTFICIHCQHWNIIKFIKQHILSEKLFAVHCALCVHCNSNSKHHIIIAYS